MFMYLFTEIDHMIVFLDDQKKAVMTVEAQSK